MSWIIWQLYVGGERIKTNLIKTNTITDHSLSRPEDQ